MVTEQINSELVSRIPPHAPASFLANNLYSTLSDLRSQGKSWDGITNAINKLLKEIEPDIEIQVKASSLCKAFSRSKAESQSHMKDLADQTIEPVSNVSEEPTDDLDSDNSIQKVFEELALISKQLAFEGNEPETVYQMALSPNNQVSVTLSRPINELDPKEVSKLVDYLNFIGTNLTNYH